MFTDGGVECDFLEHYVGRIDAIYLYVPKSVDSIWLDISSNYNAETVKIPIAHIKDVRDYNPTN